MCFITISWQDVEPSQKIDTFNSSKSPSWVIFDITTECNLQCSYCFNKKNNNYKNISRISADKFREILLLLHEQGIRQITLGGGEPLLHPDIVSFVRQITDLGIECHIISNGYLLDKELSTQLKQAGLSQIQMNIDSLDPKLHDQIRGRVGSYRKVIDAFTNAIDAGLVTVAQTVMTMENGSELLDIFDYSRNLGIHRSRVWPDIYTYLSRAYRDELDRLINDIKDYAELNNAVSVLSYGLELDDDLSCRRNVMCPPRQGMTYSIGADTKAYLCSARKDLSSIGFNSWRTMSATDISKKLIQCTTNIDSHTYCGSINNLASTRDPIVSQ